MKIKHLKINMNQIRLFSFKVLGFFIPYFKRMLNRQTIIDTINQMLSSILNKEGYYHNTHLEVTSDQGIHSIVSEVQLLCGQRLIIEIYYENHNVGSAVKVGDHNRLNNTDLSEMAKVSGIIERELNIGALVDMFENYNP